MKRDLMDLHRTLIAANRMDEARLLLQFLNDQFITLRPTVRSEFLLADLLDTAGCTVRYECFGTVARFYLF